MESFQIEKSLKFDVHKELKVENVTVSFGDFLV